MESNGYYACYWCYERDEKENLFWVDGEEEYACSDCITLMKPCSRCDRLWHLDKMVVIKLQFHCAECIGIYYG